MWYNLYKGERNYISLEMFTVNYQLSTMKSNEEIISENEEDAEKELRGVCYWCKGKNGTLWTNGKMLDDTVQNTLDRVSSVLGLGRAIKIIKEFRSRK